MRLRSNAQNLDLLAEAAVVANMNMGPESDSCQDNNPNSCKSFVAPTFYNEHLAQPFLDAAHRKDLQECKNLLNKLSAPPHARNSLGESALHLVFDLHDDYCTDIKPLVRFLLSANVNPNSVSLTGETPLHYALEEESEDLVETVNILIQSKADCNSVASNGDTVVHRALTHIHSGALLSVLQALFAGGGRASPKDVEWAINNKKPQEVIQLLETQIQSQKESRNAALALLTAKLEEGADVSVEDVDMIEDDGAQERFEGAPGLCMEPHLNMQNGTNMDISLEEIRHEVEEPRVKRARLSAPGGGDGDDRHAAAAAAARVEPAAENFLPNDYLKERVQACDDELGVAIGSLPCKFKTRIQLLEVAGLLDASIDRAATLKVLVNDKVSMLERQLTWCQDALQNILKSGGGNFRIELDFDHEEQLAAKTLSNQLDE